MVLYQLVQLIFNSHGPESSIKLFDHGYAKTIGISDTDIKLTNGKFDPHSNRIINLSFPKTWAIRHPSEVDYYRLCELNSIPRLFNELFTSDIEHLYLIQIDVKSDIAGTIRLDNYSRRYLTNDSTDFFEIIPGCKLYKTYLFTSSQIISIMEFPDILQQILRHNGQLFWYCSKYFLDTWFVPMVRQYPHLMYYYFSSDYDQVIYERITQDFTNIKYLSHKQDKKFFDFAVELDWTAIKYVPEEAYTENQAQIIKVRGGALPRKMKISDNFRSLSRYLKNKLD